MSCRFINYLEQKDTFIIEMFDNEELAFEASKQGQVWGYITFHGNFSKAFLNRVWSHMQTDEITRNQSTIHVSHMGFCLFTK